MKLSRQKPVSNLTISFYFGFTTFKASKALSFRPLQLCLLKKGVYALPHACVSHGTFLDHAPHVIRQRSKPNTLKSQTHSNPKHTQIQDTWVGNSHACFQETSLKTLTPILQ